MNAVNVKSRRIAALADRNADRVLVAPRQKASDLCLPNPNTKASQVIDALVDGLTLEQLMAETEWSKHEAMSNLYRIAKKTGLGIHRRAGKLYLDWPEVDADWTADHHPMKDVTDVKAA